MERSLLSYFGIKFDEEGFDWNEYEQGLALGSFYWLYWLTQVPGGILSKKYGPKVVYGVSNFLSALFCFVMPIASYLSFDALIILRVVQGVVTGFAWPAMQTMVGSWIPPNERSKFVSSYLGSSFGVFINYPLFGAIISISCWENVFHFCGIFGTVWFLAWCYFVYDTPAMHPRIAQDERQYIEKSLGTTVQKKIYPTPWKEILTSKIVWMILIAQWGGGWGLFTLMTQAPTYFKYIHGWDIKMSGFLSGLPHLLRILFSLFFSWCADYLLRHEKMSRTNVRKVGTAISTIVNGFFVLGLAYSGCNSFLAIVMLNLSVGFHGAVSSGPHSAMLDASPNHAGIISGISGTTACATGFISPIIVGLLTLNNQTAKQWEYVFLITAGMLFISGVLYCFFGDSKLQKWNSPETENDVEIENLDKKSAKNSNN
ncbi:putative inorganic phosphate cotransporter [Culicoides brevitarsis]|uniref:putative inorganic phosphate cotransporter n=1 Tax=Culicoides brevitarsis TaxID=469753 RepID=UPI00307C85B9